MKQAKIKLTGPSIFNVNALPNPITEIEITVGEQKLICEFPKPVEYVAGWFCDVFNIFGLSAHYDGERDVIVVE